MKAPTVVTKRRPRMSLVLPQKPAEPSPALERQPKDDYGALDFRQLLDARQRLQAEIETRQTEEIERIRASITASASDLGISVPDLIGPLVEPSSKTYKPKHVKYRGPGGEEWSGKGPAPRWLKLLEEDGKSRENFYIG